MTGQIDSILPSINPSSCELYPMEVFTAVEISLLTFSKNRALKFAPIEHRTPRKVKIMGYLCLTCIAAVGVCQRVISTHSILMFHKILPWLSDSALITGCPSVLCKDPCYWLPTLFVEDCITSLECQYCRMDHPSWCVLHCLWVFKTCQSRPHFQWQTVIFFCQMLASMWYWTLCCGSLLGIIVRHAAIDVSSKIPSATLYGQVALVLVTSGYHYAIWWGNDIHCLLAFWQKEQEILPSLEPVHNMNESACKIQAWSDKWLLFPSILSPLWSKQHDCLAAAWRGME